VQRDTCLTFGLQNPPTRLVPENVVDVGGIRIVNLTGLPLALPFSSMKVLVTLVKKPFSESRSRVTSVFAIFNASVWTLPSIKLNPGQEIPASDFVWALKLDEPAISNVYTTFENISVSVLDVLPMITSFSSSDLSFTGSNISIDCVPSGPSAIFYLPLFTVSNVTNASCVFFPVQTGSSSLSRFSQRAHFAHISRTLITLHCEPLSNGQLGPPLSVWKASVLFPDGRESPASTTNLNVRCPARMFIELNVTNICVSPPCCLACPSPMSASLVVDAIGIESCVCRPGYFGSSGLSCTPCPKNVEGFNCILSNQSWPMIQSGYFIDYSLLSGCSEHGPKCHAIVMCPNKKACPSTTEKECLKTDEECYDSRAFGCTACCPKYYIENFICNRCPPNQLPLILSMCTLALILFAVFSSTFDFPPAVSVAQSLKLFLSSMQGFVSIRLLAISWPPIILKMFDFTRYFTFNFDVIRPECTVEYTPQTKLLFVLIGPVACAFFIVMMILVYSVFKCCRVSNMLQKDCVKFIHNKNFYETAWSVAQCLVTTSFSLKFSKSRMMIDGSLWNAISPDLVMRTNTLVLQQKVRRGAVTQNILNDAAISPAQALVVPKDWIRMQDAVAQVQAEPEFARSAKRFRLLVASALSIFVFTFQSSMESALSTFNCKGEGDARFLRSNPKYKCSFDDSMYSSMVTTTIIGLVMYGLLLPVVTMITLRSRWCREVYMHDSMAYGQMFGFLTSMYSKTCVLWELVACVRKVVFVAIPILFPTDTLVQSVSLFTFLIIYSFFVLKMQPMVSSTLNQIEILSCVSVIVGCFSSIFFVVEHNGNQVLSGASRDLAGLMLVIVCSICVLLSFRLIWNDFSSTPIQTFSKHCTLIFMLQNSSHTFQGSCCYTKISSSPSGWLQSRHGWQEFVRKDSSFP
jgi:hypothetical protein